MKRCFRNILKTAVIALVLVGILSPALSPVVASAQAPLITTAKDLKDALASAQSGDTILVGDITFNRLPQSIVQVAQNVTIKSGKDTNAVFTGATFGILGSNSDAVPLNVRFENIDFRGDNAGNEIDPENPPEITSIMNTMCAGIFQFNVNAVYDGCTFDGYHYGNGGVFCAIYSSSDHLHNLTLSLTDCEFRNNAGGLGGCVYLSGKNFNIDFNAEHCRFEGNAAATGGAIFADNANVRLLDCEFLGNRYIEKDLKKIGPNGGALALDCCGANIDGCLFAGNTSGGKGDAIYCELTQSKTLFMKNSTVIGNSAESSGGICVTPTDTNFDSTPRAQICLSTLLGKQDLGDHASLFGCLIGDNGAVPCEPSAENGYCLTVSETALRDRCGVNGTSHISLPAGDHPLTREATESIAGGKFANSLGLLKVGDNYCKETTFSLVSAKKNVATFTVRYGETVRLEDPERNGFSFTGWRYADGTELNAETVFIGGDLPEDMLVAEWNLEPMKNGFVLGGFGILLLGVLTVLLLLLLKKRKPEVLTEEQPMPCEKVLPENWINLVCERPDVTEAVSRREMDVLRKLLEGKSRKQIADELFISEATVKKHSASIYGKFKVHNRNELLFKLTK